MCSVSQSVTATAISVLIDATSCKARAKKVSMAVIVGSVVGGVAVLTVAVIIVLYLFRRSVPFFPRARTRRNTPGMYNVA